MNFNGIKIMCKEIGVDDAEIIDTTEIEFNPAFRPYCEENICGQYGVNYSCPPNCGTTDEMKQRVLSHKKALVTRTVWDIADITDSEKVKAAKKIHNGYTFKIIEEMRKDGHNGFMIGTSGCTLCVPCALKSGEPCNFPDKRYSCMSAYCIYVKALAEKCNMTYDYKDGKLPLFSMYVFD